MWLTRPTWFAYRRILAAPLRSLDAFAAMDPGRRRQMQADRLLTQIRYFGSRDDALAEWRELRSARSDEVWSAWPSLPIITKATLNRQFDPAEMQRRFRLKGRINSTGGSTGEPTRFFLDTRALRASRAVHYYTQFKMGWRPGMPTVVLWGSDRDIGKQSAWYRRAAQYLYGQELIPGFAIGDSALSRVRRIIENNQNVAIYGYSSLLEFLAQRFLALGLETRNRVAAAWNGGEMLYDHQVELFKKAFGTPILNRYGGRELSAIAFQTAEHGPLTLVRPWLYVEIVDDAGRPVGPNQPGRIIVTSTTCRGTPFLRYDIGDLGAYSADQKDESGICGLASLNGRHAGSIRLEDGRIISSLYWNHLLKDYREVKQFQVRVSQKEKKVSLLLVGSGFDPVRSDQLKATIRKFLQNQQIEINWATEIPKTREGKLVQVLEE